MINMYFKQKTPKQERIAIGEGEGEEGKEQGREGGRREGDN